MTHYTSPYPRTAPRGGTKTIRVNVEPTSSRVAEQICESYEVREINSSGRYGKLQCPGREEGQYRKEKELGRSLRTWREWVLRSPSEGYVETVRHESVIGRNATMTMKAKQVLVLIFSRGRHRLSDAMEPYA